MLKGFIGCYSLNALYHFTEGDSADVAAACLDKIGGQFRYGSAYPDLGHNDFTHEICFNPNSIARIMRLCGFRNIETREQGPNPWGYSLKSTGRFLVWQTIRLGLKLWNAAETGDTGSGIFSRVFLASGIRK